MAYVDIDFDAALADHEGTRRRLAAGVKLRLLTDGLPFTYLVKPEDIDGFVERTANPSSAQFSLPIPQRAMPPQHALDKPAPAISPLGKKLAPLWERIKESGKGLLTFEEYEAEMREQRRDGGE